MIITAARVVYFVVVIVAAPVNRFVVVVVTFLHTYMMGMFL